ncbi:MAG: 23S rRNA (adenine(2503)-C(2))-methyltransferase RlmN [Candidatus Omnitrophota bacterium]
MASPKNILDLSFDEISFFLKSINEKAFHSRQIFDWIYHKGILDFDGMKNLSRDLRLVLKTNFYFPETPILKESLNKDKTGKYLFGLPDGQKIETVLIPAAGRLTICVSSQVGCKFACAFCASGIGGWKRNLSSGEMLMQILQAQSLSKSKVTHVVFMGMGEPLDNWDEVRKAIETINSPGGLNIAARRITVSTCGIPDKIDAVADFGRQIELAVSLHGYNDEVRSKLMPINKRYPLAVLVQACRKYVRRTNRQVTFEYIVIPDVTMTAEAPKALAGLLRGFQCKINLIPYNIVEEFPWTTPSPRAVYRFRDELISLGVHTTIRWSKGLGADGACGQLRRK